MSIWKYGNTKSIFCPFCLSIVAPCWYVLQTPTVSGVSSHGQLPEYWTQDLQCALHLNLSIAYKAIGNIRKAVHHAEVFVKVIAGCETRRPAEAHSHLNVGTLYEMLGEYQLAEQHFKAYLEKSKQQGDTKGIAQAYGCLGSVYAHLDNRKLSATYHEQQIALAKKTGDQKMHVAALEQSGDSCRILGDHEEAANNYSQMLDACGVKDSQSKATALCKLGNAHWALERNQHGVCYYEQAQSVAENCGYTAVTMICEYSLACIWQNSMQVLEMDRSRKLFLKLIPLFEAKIQQHQDEDTYCPPEIHSQLQECYRGIQNILAKLGNKAECLEYSESAKKSHSVISHDGEPSHGMSDAWSINKMSHVVTQQSATVLYYTILPSSLLIWVLQPDEGLARFHTSRARNKQPIAEQVQCMLAEVKQNRNTKELQYSCENRALPLQETPLELLRKKNHALSQASKREEYIRTLEHNMCQKELKQKEPQKAVQRRLFDLLIAPVEDILSKLAPESPLIIVPDGILYHCPFGILEDWHGQALADRFHLTYLPNLHSLEVVIQNELNLLKVDDDLHFQRSQARLGGIPKVLAQAEHARMSKESSAEEASDLKIDLKRISNPRLVTSGSKGMRDQGQGQTSARTRQQSFLSRVTESTVGRKPGGPSTAQTASARTALRTPRVADSPTGEHHHYCHCTVGTTV